MKHFQQAHLFHALWRSIENAIEAETYFKPFSGTKNILTISN